MKNLLGIIIAVIAFSVLKPVIQNGIIKGNDLLNLAQQSFLDGELEVSLNYYSRLIESYPDEWLYYYNRAMLQLMVGDTSSAEHDFNEAQLKRPKNPWPIYQQAMVSRMRGDYSLAIDKLLQVISLDRKHALAFADLGRVAGSPGYA